MLAKRLNNRLEVLAVIIVLVFLCLVSRLGYLQVVQGKYYGQKADGNRIRLVPTMAPRGIFLIEMEWPPFLICLAFTVSLLPINGEIPEDIIVKLASILMINVDEIKKDPIIQTGIRDGFISTGTAEQ